MRAAKVTVRATKILNSIAEELLRFADPDNPKNQFVTIDEAIAELNRRIATHERALSETGLSGGDIDDVVGLLQELRETRVRLQELRNFRNYLTGAE